MSTTKRQQQIDQSRRLIEEGLIQAARNRPYSQLSNEQIVKASGVSRMTYYRHFQNKREVLLSLLERLSGEIGQRSHGKPEKGTGVGGLAEMLHRRFTVLLENQHLHHLLTDPHAREVFREFRWPSFFRIAIFTLWILSVRKSKW